MTVERASRSPHIDRPHATADVLRNLARPNAVRRVAFSRLLFAVGQEMTRHSRKRKAVSRADGEYGR